MWDSNLNCGIAREREKINRPEHTAGRSQNKGRTEQFPGRASQLQTGPSPTGGRRQGGGERGKLGLRDGTPYQMANRLPVCNQILPEILDGRHPPGGSWLEASSWEQTQGAHTWLAHVESEAGTAEGMRCTAPGESVPVKLLAAWAACMGKAQNAGPIEFASLWNTWKLEPQ